MRIKEKIIFNFWVNSFKIISFLLLKLNYSRYNLINLRNKIYSKLFEIHKEKGSGNVYY